MNAPRDVSFDDYMVESMKNPTQAAAYIEAVVELNDPAALLVALRHVAKAHGMTKLSSPALMAATTFNPLACCCFWGVKSAQLHRPPYEPSWRAMFGHFSKLPALVASNRRACWKRCLPEATPASGF